MNDRLPDPGDSLQTFAMFMGLTTILFIAVPAFWALQIVMLMAALAVLDV